MSKLPEIPAGHLLITKGGKYRVIHPRRLNGHRLSGWTVAEDIKHEKKKVEAPPVDPPEKKIKATKALKDKLLKAITDGDNIDTAELHAVAKNLKIDFEKMPRPELVDLVKEKLDV